jgi:tRNA1(Val) A37 N6-methylase TrmN6
MINERKKECIRILDEYGFSIARTQEIKSFGKRPPILFMVKATSGKIHETIIDKPLILKNSEGNDSRVFKKLMEKHV